MERESVQGERVCIGGRGFESETQGSQTRKSRRAEFHKRGVQDPRSSQDTRRTRTRSWVPRRVSTRRTQTRAWAPRRVDTRRTQTRA